LESTLNKKNRAIVLGATGNMAFAVANVLMGIKKHSPSMGADFVIFHNNLSEKDRDLLNSIVPCQFVDYKFPIEITPELENSSFGRYSKLAFSRYECFRMLDEYQKVLWIDIDILVQKDISGIFDYAKTGISLYREVVPLQQCFSIAVEGYDMEGAHYNSGVLLLSDILPEYHKKADWLYETTVKYGKHLKYADQGIVNLLVQEFNLDVDRLPEQYNCHPTKKSSKTAPIVHSYSPQKFWAWYERAYQRNEWDKNYRQWLKMGGSAYNGVIYRPIERWCKAHIRHDCPNPLRQPSKFVKFMAKGCKNA
jgi:lipopolysaccharide biosynthesis glycosyltransferase